MPYCKDINKDFFILDFCDNPIITKSIAPLPCTVASKSFAIFPRVFTAFKILIYPRKNKFTIIWIHF